MVASPPPLLPRARVATAAKLRCPRCDSGEVQLLSSQQMFPPLAHDRPGCLRVTISTYKCRCGIGFTNTTTCEETPDSSCE